VKDITIKLHPFTDDTAYRAADDIRAAGTISYTDNSGSTVNVTVGDVTVEDRN
jgi:hypothetical protein